MALYDFNNQLTACPKTGHPQPGVELHPQIQTRPSAVSQLSDIQQGRSKIYGDLPGTQPDYVEEFLIPGFRSLDEAMKVYWSGMRVPTKDAYRFMRIKVAGGDKSLLFWRDQLRDGRARLPVASLNRTSHDFNPDKFSPAYLSMTKRYLSKRMDRVAMIFRPVPFLVRYDLIVWASYKRDADYVLYQILTRFNPLAEFTMHDEHIQGNVQLRFEGSQDASEKELGFDQGAKIRYEYSMVAEAWLPLPEKIVPTILGHVAVVRELTQTISAVLGNQ